MPWVTLSLKNLINALHEVGDWQGLGIQLDIEYCELQKIAKVHPTVEERKYAMLQFWLDKDIQASWETVLVSLGKMNLERIAEKIKKEFQTPTSTQSQGEPPLVLSATAQSANVTTMSKNVTTEDSPSTPRTAQPEQTWTTQSESATMALPSTPPTEQPEQTGVRKMQQEIATLVNKYDDLVSRTVETFSEMQEDSPHFCRRLQISVAVLPTSLKYQHRHFLEYHSSQIAKSTTVAEIMSILNNYCDFLNCSLLAHIIGKFGDDKLKKQLSNYMEALQEFRSHTKIADFMETCIGSPNLSPEFVALETKMSPEWEHRTLEEAEKYHKTMTQNSSFANYVVSLVKVKKSSIYLVWSVPKHAIQFLAAAMDSDFLQHHGIEAVAIGGEDLEAYKRQHYLFFEVIHQHVDELSEGLIWASQEGCLEDVVFLLSTGVEVNSRGQWRGRTALMQASEGGYLDVVKELLRAQAGVDLQDEYGDTALMVASHQGHADIMQELLSGGAQVDLQDKDGWTALIWASFCGKMDAVQELLSSGAQVDLQNKDGDTALMEASRQGHAVIIQELLSGGAQVDLQDKLGWSALMWAGLQGHTDIIRELLLGGAQVDLQDKNGMTALIWASHRGETEVVQELLSSGAKVDLQNETSGRSAVFYGAEKDDLEMVKLLIQGGANLNLKDKDGVTAAEVAEANGHQAVCEELRKHMHGGRRPLSKTIHDRVLATGKFLRALYKRLEERILRTQKKELASRTQGLDPEIPFPSTPKMKGVK